MCEYNVECNPVLRFYGVLDDGKHSPCGRFPAGSYITSTRSLHNTTACIWATSANISRQREASIKKFRDSVPIHYAQCFFYLHHTRSFACSCSHSCTPFSGFSLFRSHTTDIFVVYAGFLFASMLVVTLVWAGFFVLFDFALRSKCLNIFYPLLENLSLVAGFASALRSKCLHVLSPLFAHITFVAVFCLSTCPSVFIFFNGAAEKPVC